MFKNTNKKNLMRFIKVMFQYKKQHFFAATFMIINALLMLTLPYLTMKIIDSAIKANNVSLLIRFIIFYLIAILLQSGSKLLSDYIYSLIGKRIVYDLRFRLVKHLQRLSGRYYSNAKAGELMAVINNDVAAVEELATKMIFSTISDVFMSIGMLIFLAQLQFDLLILSLILQPLLMYIQSKYNKKITQTTTDLRNTFGQFSTIVQEFLSAMLHFVVLNAKKHFLRKYVPAAKNFMKIGVGLEMTFSLSMISANLISALTTIGILGYGGYKVILGTMTLGGLVAFNQYSQRLLAPIIRVAQLNMKTRKALVSIDKIFGVLDEPIDINPLNGGYKPQKIIGRIQFNSVGFSYEKDTPLFENINISFESGKITALVGESGSGKTTISHLLLRLWDVEEGEILLDGRNIKDYNLKFLRKSISVVSQDVFLFNDTLLSNLVLADEKITMEKVLEAVKSADIYDFIMTLPQQFDTIVGDRGIKLSGGQKQRISIARAILKNSSIIVLDEATSSLDNISEKYIKENLSNLLRNKTVIIIAHRLSTVEKADLIYTMKDGQVVEKGNHDELMKLRNIYYNLYMENVS